MGNLRARIFAVIGTILVVAIAFLANANSALGVPPAQGNPTEQQETINAVIEQRFAATTQAEQVIAATQTSEAAVHEARVATANYEATLDAAFSGALTATAHTFLPTPYELLVVNGKAYIRNSIDLSSNSEIAFYYPSEWGIKFEKCGNGGAWILRPFVDGAEAELLVMGHQCLSETLQSASDLRSVSTLDVLYAFMDIWSWEDASIELAPQIYVDPIANKSIARAWFDDNNEKAVAFAVTDARGRHTIILGQIVPGTSNGVVLLDQYARGIVDTLYDPELSPEEKQDFADGEALRSQTQTQESAVTIGLSLAAEDRFGEQIRMGAQRAAERQGAILLTSFAEHDSVEQSKQISEWIEQGVDAILIEPVNGVEFTNLIEIAHHANIPVFTINDPSRSNGIAVSHIGSDNVAGGRMAGMYLAEYLAMAPGEVGRVVELESAAGTSAAMELTQGFNEGIAGYPLIEPIIRNKVNASRADGKVVFAQVLAENHDIAGVFAHSDEVALGAIEAAKEAGRATDIVFVSIGASTDDTIEAIDNGDLFATLVEQPAEFGRVAVETAVSVLAGAEVNSFIGIDMSLITR